MGRYALPFLIATFMFLVLSFMSGYGWISETAGKVSIILGLVSLIILVFPGLPYISYRFKLKKL
jgi:hypothetical protein